MNTTGLLTRKDIAVLESFQEETSGYFYKMLDYLISFIEKGVEEGRFSEEEARKDLEIALWYSYACNNIDEYEYYYQAAQWMPDSEENATGCATWYYRYSVALQYCGKPRMALEYAEKGAREEPDYPWVWLQLGKLRSHFGDRQGALLAVRQGLALEPGDYEFLTLKKEIEEGRSLEEMEYHWIDPDNDQVLQDGLDENADEKQRAIACILCHEEALEEIKALFSPKDWEADCPYCSFHIQTGEQEITYVFRMNEAGLSKMNLEWLKERKRRLENPDLLTQSAGSGKTGFLHMVFFGMDYRICLIYKLLHEDLYFQLWILEDGSLSSSPDPSKEDRTETQRGGSFHGQNGLWIPETETSSRSWTPEHSNGFWKVPD